MLKWFLLAMLIGVVVGSVDALFLKLLDKSIHFTHTFPLYYIGLPITLYIVYLLARKWAPQELDYSTDDVIDKINTYRSVGFISAIKSLGLSIVTMATGGSAGKEAPCADAGAGISACIARLEVMFPALIAGITAFQVTTYLGVNYIYHPMHFAPIFTDKFFFTVILAGIFFALISIILTELLKFAKVVFRFITVKTSPFWRCFIGGSILVLFGLWFSPLYLGLGLEGFNSVLAGDTLHNPLGFLIKSITTAITLAAGGVGGVITPVFFIGAQAGALLGTLLGTDTATMAALGLVAVLAGAANTPLSAIIMAIELFGAPIAPYAAVTCMISFLLSGRQSIYPSQRMSFDKQKELPVMPLQHTRRLQSKKGLLLKTFKDMSKHLIPNPKGFDKDDK